MTTFCPFSILCKPPADHAARRRAYITGRSTSPAARQAAAIAFLYRRGMFTLITEKRRQRAPVALYKNRHIPRGVFLEALPLIWAAFLIDLGRVLGINKAARQQPGGV